MIRFSRFIQIVFMQFVLTGCVFLSSAVFTGCNSFLNNLKELFDPEQEVEEPLIVEPEIHSPPENQEQPENELENEEQKIQEEEMEIELKELESVVPGPNVEREWTIFIYMAADNNLEYSAMKDILEMEKSNLNTDSVTVVMLVDRSDSYDSSFGNWSDTRLFRLKTGRIADSSQFLSQEISCRPLEVNPNTSVELDLSSGYVLSEALSYILKQFPANHYGLILWGHGNGWRNTSQKVDTAFKGVAFDFNSESFMTLHQLSDALNTALNGSTLDFIGFDTCYGGEIEVAYQLKNYTKYFAGCESLESLDGWDYTSIFNQFEEQTEKTPEKLCDIIISCFETSYSQIKNASISAINMEHMQSFFYAFDSYIYEAASLIKTSDTRLKIFEILSNKVKRYAYLGEGNDIYLDLFDLVQQTFSFLIQQNVSMELQSLYLDFLEKEAICCFNNWASDKERGGLGIYFSSYTNGNIISTNFPGMYVKQDNQAQIAFVQDSYGYVPTKKLEGTFLDKLFYMDLQ